MADQIVIGFPEIFHHAESWDTGAVAHGRETTAGDAENTLDLAPGVVHRLPSAGSGEIFYHMNLLTQNAGTPSWMNVGGALAHGNDNEFSWVAVDHNLLGVAPKFRFGCYGSDGLDILAPTSTTATTNSTSTFADVDGDPYNNSTFATPTAQGTDWDIEVGFSPDADNSKTGVDLQTVVVELKWTGTQPTTAKSVQVEIKENGSQIATSTINPRLSTGDVWITRVSFDATDLTNDATGGTMTVKVSCTQDGAGNYWSVGGIRWFKIDDDTANIYDSEWITVQGDSGLSAGSAAAEGTTAAHMAPYNRHTTHVFPILDSSGNLQTVPDDLPTGGSAWLFWLMADWDETSRIIQAPDGDGDLTAWRPEIGVVAAGKAISFSSSLPTGGVSVEYVDLSKSRRAKGGALWTRRRGGYRRATVNLIELSASDISDKIGPLQLLGAGDVIALSVGPNVADLRDAFGFLGYLEGPPRVTHTHSGNFGLSFTVTELR